MVTAQGHILTDYLTMEVLRSRPLPCPFGGVFDARIIVVT